MCAWADMPVGLRSYGVILWEIVTGEQPDRLRGLRAPKCATKPWMVVVIRQVQYHQGEESAYYGTMKHIHWVIRHWAPITKKPQSTV